MTINERRRQRLFQAKEIAAMTHEYSGTRNTWYGEPIYQCSCGDFESHELYKVEAHVKAEMLAKEIERIREDGYDFLAGTR